MRAVHEMHARSVYHFLLRTTLGNREAAEDLLQETLLRAWRNVDRLTTSVEALRPWLFTVARNLAIDAGRARQLRPPEDFSSDISRLPAGTDSVERLLTAATVREALLKLSTEHRAVLVELYYRDASAAETAERIGIPEGTVKSRAHYGLRALAHILGTPHA